MFEKLQRKLSSSKRLDPEPGPLETRRLCNETADLCAIVSDRATARVSIFQADPADPYLHCMGMQFCIVIGPGRPQESHPPRLELSKRVEASSGRDDVGGG